MLMSSSWLRWLDEPSERLELAELNGCSDGQGEGGPPIRDNVAPHPNPERRLGLYLGGPRKGTVDFLYVRAILNASLNSMGQIYSKKMLYLNVLQIVDI